METHNLSDYDRALIVGLTDAVTRLACSLEAKKEERVYSCKDAAAMLGKTPQTINRYLRQGRIKRGERGGVVGIPESEIQKLMRR